MGISEDAANMQSLFGDLDTAAQAQWSTHLQGAVTTLGGLLDPLWSSPMSMDQSTANQIGAQISAVDDKAQGSFDQDSIDAAAAFHDGAKQFFLDWYDGTIDWDQAVGNPPPGQPAPTSGVKHK